MNKKKLLEDNEKCLDCEEALENHEGHGGSPHEPYDEGFHVCGKKNPRVTKKKVTFKAVEKAFKTFKPKSSLAVIAADNRAKRCL